MIPSPGWQSKNEKWYSHITSALSAAGESSGKRMRFSCASYMEERYENGSKLDL